MVEPRDYPQIDEFLGESGRRTDTIEENLAIMTRQDFENLSSALDYIGPDDPEGDWKNEMYKGNVTRAFSEIILCWHFRRVLGQNAVTLNAEYTDTGKDFDLLVKWRGHDYWIDVRTPDGALGEVQAKGGGYISGRGTGSSIDNKLKKQFALARETLSEDAILVLAVYLNATFLDQLLIGKRYHDIDEEDHPGQYCDAFLEFYHRQGKTVMDVREWTDKGAVVAELHKELVQN